MAFGQRLIGIDHHQGAMNDAAAMDRGLQLLRLGMVLGPTMTICRPVITVSRPLMKEPIEL